MVLPPTVIVKPLGQQGSLLHRLVESALQM
jgi:hypothetical protein